MGERDIAAPRILESSKLVQPVNEGCGYQIVGFNSPLALLRSRPSRRTFRNGGLSSESSGHWMILTILRVPGSTTTVRSSTTV